MKKKESTIVVVSGHIVSPCRHRDCLHPIPPTFGHFCRFLTSKKRQDGEEGRQARYTDKDVVDRDKDIDDHGKDVVEGRSAVDDEGVVDHGKGVVDHDKDMVVDNHDVVDDKEDIVDPDKEREETERKQRERWGRLKKKK